MVEHIRGDCGSVGVSSTPAGTAASGQALSRFGAATLVFVLAAICMAALVGNARDQDQWLRPHDDQNYLFALSQALFQPRQAETLHVELREAMVAYGSDESVLTRLDLRWDYRRNYLASSAVAAGATEIAAALVDEDRDFAAFAATSQTLGAAFLIGLACLVLALAVILARERALAVAIAIGVVLVVFETTIDLDATNRLLPIAGEGDVSSVPAFFAGLARLAVDPGSSTYLFGNTPRNAFMVLLLASFVLRWSGRFGLAYTLFLPMTVVHQSQTGLLLAMVVAIDVVMRPRLFLKPSILAPVLVVATAFLARERIWSIVGAAPALLGALLVVAAALAVAGAVATLRTRRSRELRPSSAAVTTLKRAHGRISGAPVLVSDLSLLTIGWCAFAALTALGNLFASPSQSVFFWSHISGRVFGLIRPVLIVGVAAVALRRLAWPNDDARWPALAGATAAIALVFAVVERPLATYRSVVERNTAAYETLAAEIETPLTRPISLADEAGMYFAVARALRRGNGLDISWAVPYGRTGD